MNVPDIDETTKVAPSPKPRKFKTVLCRHYGTPKGCFKGDSCSFVHADPQPKEPETVGSPSNPSNTSLEEVKVTPALSETSPCRRFMWNGSCRFGDSCKFRHTRSDGEELQASSTAPLDEVANLSAPDKVEDDNTSPEPPEETGAATPLAGITSNQPASSTPAWWSFRTITILSEDEQRIWTISGEELVPHSELLASILTYSSQGLNGGTNDPCKNVRGLVRRQSGQDDFQLSGVGADDFDVFLTVLRAHPEFSFPSDDLRITLTLASDWGFDDLRRRAKRGLEMCNISVLDKITLARRCKDHEWIQEAYVALATRVAPLSAEEIKALGINPTTAIARARERVLIQRLRALPLQDADQWKCKRISCRQALRDAWVKILSEGGSPDIPHLAVSAVLLDGMVSSGTVLCETCASDEALAKALEDWQIERTVAEATIEQFMGEIAVN